MLGSKLAESALGKFDITATYHTVGAGVPSRLVLGSGKRPIRWKYAEKATVVGLIKIDKFDYVIDTAAFHNVDECEENELKAFTVNGIIPGQLAEATVGVGGRYVFISTDFVFDGEKPLYVESDTPHPVNAYGISKVRGELEVLDVSSENQVVRPSVIYGWNDSRLNFATWLLTSLQQGKEVRIVTDWYGSPTFADSLADAILKLLRIGEGGIFHLAGPDCMSRYDFALKLARGFDLDEKLIRPVKASSLTIGTGKSMKAPRPPYSCLTNNRARRRGISTFSVEKGIRFMRTQRSLKDFVVPKRFKS